MHIIGIDCATDPKKVGPALAEGERCACDASSLNLKPKPK